MNCIGSYFCLELNKFIYKTNIALKSSSAPSVINRIELLGYHQITSQDEQELTAFLNQLICLELSQSVQDKAIEVRKFHKIKLADSIVLATALAHDLELLTLDNGLNNKFLKERNIYF